MLVGEGDGGGIIRANKAAKQRTSQSHATGYLYGHLRIFPAVFVVTKRRVSLRDLRTF